MIESIVKMLMNFTSNVIEKVLPDEPSEKELNTLKNSTILAYTTAKTFGEDIVESTENTYDNKAIEELIESCQEAAKKYGFELPNNLD